MAGRVKKKDVLQKLEMTIEHYFKAKALKDEVNETAIKVMLSYLVYKTNKVKVTMTDAIVLLKERL